MWLKKSITEVNYRSQCISCYQWTNGFIQKTSDKFWRHKKFTAEVDTAKFEAIGDHSSTYYVRKEVDEWGQKMTIFADLQ